MQQVKNQSKPVAKGKRLPFRTGFFYGWIMVIVSGMGLFFSGPGQTYSNSVFIESYILDLGLERTAVSSIYSAATLLSGLLLFGVGRLVDRFGRRIMMTLAAFMLGVACFFNSLVTGPVMLFIGFFMVRYFGQGSMTLIPNTLVSQWFYQYRGRALSFASLGGLLGAASFPPLINWLLELYGWQVTWRVLGAILMLIVVPLSYYLIRNKPEDVGLLPDGRIAVEMNQTGTQTAAEQEETWTLSEAVRTRSFWLLLVCGAIPAMLFTGITFQLFSILGDQGINRTTTAFMLSIVPLVSFVCSIASGFIVERVKVNRMLAITMALNGAAPIILLFANSYITVLLFAIVWGFAQGLINIPLNVIWPAYYGRANLGSIQSITTTALVIGSALGPVMFGWSYDRFGNYESMLITSAVIFVIGGILAAAAGQPKRVRRS